MVMLLGSARRTARKSRTHRYFTVASDECLPSELRKPELGEAGQSVRILRYAHVQARRGASALHACLLTDNSRGARTQKDDMNVSVTFGSPPALCGPHSPHHRGVVELVGLLARVAASMVSACSSVWPCDATSSV